MASGNKTTGYADWLGIYHRFSGSTTCPVCACSTNSAAGFHKSMHAQMRLSTITLYRDHIEVSGQYSETVQSAFMLCAILCSVTDCCFSVVVCVHLTVCPFCTF